MDATVFLEEVYSASGGLVERQADRLLALAGAGSGLPESAEVWAGLPETCPEGLELLHPGHPLLEAAVQRALQTGRFGLRHLVAGTSRRQGLAELARRTFGFRNARVELGEGLPSVVPWAIFHFHVTFLWDEKREDLVSIPVDLHTGARAPLASLEKAWLDQGGLPGADRSNLPAGLEFARRHLRLELAPRIQALRAQAKSHLEVEEARLSSYYGGLLEDLGKRLRSASSERRAGLEAKRVQAEADWEARRAEMQDKFRLRVRAELACLEVVDLPRVLMPARLLVGKSAHERVLSYNLLTREFDPLACQVCLGATHVVWGCESGHVACARCHSACIACGRLVCRACPGQDCARCGARLCPECQACSAGCEQRASAAEAASQESRAAARAARKVPQTAAARLAQTPSSVARDVDLVRGVFQDLLRKYFNLAEILAPVFSLVEQRKLKAAGERLAQLECDLRDNEPSLPDRVRRVGSCLRSSEPNQAISRLRKLHARLSEEGVLAGSPDRPAPSPRASRPPARSSVPTRKARPPKTQPFRTPAQSSQSLEMAQSLLRSVLPGCGAPEDFVERAVALLERERDLVGKSDCDPAGWAAAATYLLTQGMTQAYIGSWFGVSASVVSNRSREIRWAATGRR